MGERAEDKHLVAKGAGKAGGTICTARWNAWGGTKMGGGGSKARASAEGRARYKEVSRFGRPSDGVLLGGNM